MPRGKLIVVEGLDNVGKTTFIQYFLKKNPLVIHRKFPSRHVADTMNQIKYADINWNMFHDLFHNDLQRGIHEIEQTLASGASVVCDRYVYSHWVYEYLRGNKIPCDFVLVPNPDVIIYLRPERLKDIPNEDKDNLELGIDYEKGQERFDKLFIKKPEFRNVITIPALEWNTNDLAMQALQTILGVFV
ncbi:MAG: hypothetical protein R2685_10635 [Candidatus Nitrosocosmicus sp.]|nr:hypothetical protein [Candidatus Nitrosocosmicus sp.]